MALLEVKGVVFYYGRRKVVDGVNFDVRAGEIVGLLGPNGAGKTTSFRMTTGQLTPYAGQVWFNGQDVTQLAMYQRARLGMGYLAQETSVFRKLSVEQNILAILEVMPECRSLGRKLTKAERHERTDAVLEQFGLTRLRKNNAARLSGGERRRLEIARCLVCEPLLILLDEPFTGIDPITIDDIQQIVLQLRQQGIGLLLTDHNVHKALQITDRSYLIKDGKVRVHGSPQKIIHDPIAIEEYLGQSFRDGGFHLASELPPHNNQPATRNDQASTVDYLPIDSSPAPESRQQKPVDGERINQLVDRLKTDQWDSAKAELIRLDKDAVPALLAALERRDVELRRQAHEILQTILSGTISFDPYAPELQRKEQIADLRQMIQRRAG